MLHSHPSQLSIPLPHPQSCPFFPGHTHITISPPFLLYGWRKSGTKSTEKGLLGPPASPLPQTLHDPSTSWTPGSLTDVRVDLVVSAGSGLGLRLQANLSAFRTSLLSTRYERKMQGPWQARGSNCKC